MAPMAGKLQVAAALLTAVGSVTGQNSSTVGSGPSAAGPTWNHADFETSPPVYPSPNATGSGWDAAFQQASDFVSQLTLEEKARLVTGTPGPCTGNIGPIERLGFDGLCLQDGPLAIRVEQYASVFPAGISVAASWDKDLAYQRGVEMAQEFRGKGSHIALGPVAGPLGRSGYGGRNWEGYDRMPTAGMMRSWLTAFRSDQILARPFPYRRALWHHHRGHAKHGRAGLRQTLHWQRARDPA